MDNYLISEGIEGILSIEDIEYPITDEEYEAWIEEYESLNEPLSVLSKDILEIVDDDDYQPDIDISELR
jgi:hypothetical protein